jgi:hypothetical protein
MTPTYPSDPEGTNMGLMEVTPALLRCPDVSMDDFMSALHRIRPSVCDADIVAHVEWTHEFGQET